MPRVFAPRGKRKYSVKEGREKRNTGPTEGALKNENRLHVIAEGGKRDPRSRHRLRVLLNWVKADNVTVISVRWSSQFFKPISRIGSSCCTVDENSSPISPTTSCLRQPV